MAREINLVPDVKGEMIKALKLRNLIFFICIVVGIASLSITAILGIIVAGQQVAVNGKKETITTMSSKIKSFGDLGDFLTIKDQLGNLSDIANNKQLLSRSFGVLSALIPNQSDPNNDTISISELSINLSEENPTFSFDAQADARTAPYIDYNVLDSFKKSMQYMRYDYGEYVDKDGDPIPAYCIIESDVQTGATFIDPDKGYYAFWTIQGEGCNPLAEAQTEESTETANADEDSAIIEIKGPEVVGYDTEQYNGQTVVRIWRTPQYAEWYKEEQQEGVPYMDLDGNISNVAHFNSSCISYQGQIPDGAKSPVWTTQNNDCLLVPDGLEGIKISDSSNGRGSSSELVLRFSATISLNPEVFKFTNKHMLAIAPSGRYNVTDSYTQIQNMFAERASDCASGDAECSNANSGGN